MKAKTNLQDAHMADAWIEVQSQHEESSPTLEPNASRLAFADPEFLMRRETRGIRFQLEMLKPDLEQQAQDIQHTVVVFGSARVLSPEQVKAEYFAAQASGDPARLAQAQRAERQSKYYQEARQFARLVAQHSACVPPEQRMVICTGGGPGLMEAANRGAYESGAPTVGLNIALPHEQKCNPYLTSSLSFKFHYFALRKMHFMMRAKALVAFPGGFGTLDELFEILTLIQTRKAKALPVLLYGSTYWKKLINFDWLVEEGAIAPEDMDLFSFVDTPEAAWQQIKDYYQM
jgi:uncharacterized protein (TIGR00730 family)